MPAEHRPLATRFGEDSRTVAILCYRSLASWMLGYPAAALADADQAISDAREIGQAATLMYALLSRFIHPYFLWKIRRQQQRSLDELIALADEKGALFWKAIRNDGSRLNSLPLTGKASDAVRTLTASGIALCGQLDQLLDTDISCLIWRGLTRNSANSMTLGAASAKRRRLSKQRRKVVRGRGQSHRRGNRARVAAAGCGESASLFRARARRRASTASQILGTPRRNEPRAPLARPGQAAASSRTARSGLRLVH